jgi:hypothetical protein
MRQLHCDDRHRIMRGGDLRRAITLLTADGLVGGSIFN